MILFQVRVAPASAVHSINSYETNSHFRWHSFRREQSLLLPRSVCLGMPLNIHISRYHYPVGTPKHSITNNSRWRIYKAYIMHRIVCTSKFGRWGITHSLTDISFHDHRPTITTKKRNLVCVDTTWERNDPPERQFFLTAHAYQIQSWTTSNSTPMRQRTV